MKLKRSVYAFKGESGSGKTLAANMFLNLYLEEVNNYQRFCDYYDCVNSDKRYLPEPFSFADPLKEFLSDSLSIPLECFHESDYKDKYFLKLPEMTFVKEVDDFEHIYNVQDFVENNGLNNVKGYTKLRYVMQYVGTELIKNRFWSKTWINQRFRYFTNHRSYVIDDCRFKDESDAVYEKGGVCIRIIRKKEFLNKYNHASEQIYEDNRDIIIMNDGTEEDLFNKIKKLVEDERIA